MTYGKKLGIVPVSLEDETEKLSVEKLVDALPRQFFELFLGCQVGFCKTRHGKLLCLRSGFSEYYKYPELVEEVMKNVKLSKNYKTRIQKDFRFHAVLRKFAQADGTNETIISEMKELYGEIASKLLDWMQAIGQKYKVESIYSQTIIFTLKDLYHKYPSKHFDWLQMINSQLLKDYKVTLEDAIFIREPQSLGRFSKMFAELEET